MSYLDDVQKELAAMLVNLNDPNRFDHSWVPKVTDFVRAKLLESYKNGAQAARKRSSQNKSSKDQK